MPFAHNRPGTEQAQYTGRTCLLYCHQNTELARYKITKQTFIYHAGLSLFQKALSINCSKPFSGDSLLLSPTQVLKCLPAPFSGKP